MRSFARLDASQREVVAREPTHESSSGRGSPTILRT